MTYGYHYNLSAPYITPQEREYKAKMLRDDEIAWDIAVANLEAQLRYNNEHQA